MLSEKISIIIITSPAPSNPSTYLIDAVIRSCEDCLTLDSCLVVIVMDGYIIGDISRSKIGRVDSSMAANYELYCNNVQIKYKPPRYLPIKCSSHQGFAHAVRIGLETCGTEYAMILQHDRIFTKPFKHLSTLIDFMAKFDHIRYIGFPTAMNCNYDITLCSKYNMKHLLSQDILLQQISTGDQLNECHNGKEEKQIITCIPLIFWYDSNHFCHVRRYLEIFKPYKSLPTPLRAYIGDQNVKHMLLRPGDFIEDRFGQFQRNILVQSILNKEANLDLFRWFGSYLVWDIANTSGDLIQNASDVFTDRSNSDLNIPVSWDACNCNNSMDAPCNRNDSSYHKNYSALSMLSADSDAVRRERIFVGHLRGRKYLLTQKGCTEKARDLLNLLEENYDAGQVYRWRDDGDENCDSLDENNDDALEV